MTALVTVRTDQDWLGFVVVLGILGLCLLATCLGTRDWFRRQDDELQRIIDEARQRTEVDHLLDHIECENDDCDVTLCYCKTPARCAGTEEPGCTHIGGPMVCDRHRLAECFECREDARHDAGAHW